MGQIMDSKCACPACGQIFEFPSGLAGGMTTCTACHQAFLLPEKQHHAAIEKQSENFGVGMVLAIIGGLLCLTCYGAVLGLPLMIWGASKSSWLACSLCGTKLASRNVSICPGCRATF